MSAEGLSIYKMKVQCGMCMYIPPACLIAIRVLGGEDAVCIRKLFSVSTPEVVESLDSLVVSAPEAKRPKLYHAALLAEAAK